MGCKEDRLEPMGHDSTPPGQVSNVGVESLPGKVKLTYTLPGDPNLLYVKAVYRLNSGAMREIKASYYTNTMTLDGFGDTNVHDVQVYAGSAARPRSGSPAAAPVRSPGQRRPRFG